jgi:60 kDa SS-A/Ro ribonucleoprotein
MHCAHRSEVYIVNDKTTKRYIMKFNFKAKATVTRNHEGAKAFKMGSEMELYAAVATAGLNDQFYEAADEKLVRLRELIARTEDAFVARLAVYARERLYMRSIPLVLVVELAKIHKGEGLVKRLTARVIQRTDEITELLSYYMTANDRTGTKQ